MSLRASNLPVTSNTIHPLRCPWTRAVTVCVVACLMLARNAMADEDPLLPPDEAFVLAVDVDRAGARLRWTVAPGYFLYRERFKFEVAGQPVPNAQVVIPHGEPKMDELFGAVEILRDRFVIDLAGLSTADGELTVVSQGCADIGVCYPPQTQSVSLAITMPAMEDSLAALSALDGLGEVLGSASDQFLPADLAFVMSHAIEADGGIRVRWDIAPGYYLYRDKIAVRILEPEGAEIRSTDIARGLTRHDDYFGEVEVFYREAEALLDLQPRQTLPDTVTLELRYQGCADAGLCYPPITRELNITVTFAPDAT